MLSSIPSYKYITILSKAFMFLLVIIMNKTAVNIHVCDILVQFAR